MSKVDITKGMTVFMLDPTGNEGAGEIVEIKKVTSFNFGGAPTTEVESTTFDDTEYMDRMGGLKDPGQATLNIAHSMAEASHTLLKTLEEAGDAVEITFAVGHADGTDAPTVTGGAMTLPTTRSFMSIKGWILDWPVDFQINSTVPVPLSIRRKGKLTRAPKTGS